MEIKVEVTAETLAPAAAPEVVAATDGIAATAGRFASHAASTLPAVGEPQGTDGVINVRRADLVTTDGSRLPGVSAAAAAARDLPRRQEEVATGRSRVRLPCGATSEQRHFARENPDSTLARFGLAGNPENTWVCGRAESEEDRVAAKTKGRPPRFFATEHAFLEQGVSDHVRGQGTSDGGRLGNLSTFSTYYGKGSPQLYSDFKAALCQRVYSTFKLVRAGDGWFDPCCGGGVRQHGELTGPWC